MAAEGAILNEMLEIVAKRAALRPTSSGTELSAAVHLMSSTSATAISADGVNLMGDCGPTIYNNDESNVNERNNSKLLFFSNSTYLFAFLTCFCFWFLYYTLFIF